jgi:LPS export ABC transporter protein LptC
MSENQPKKNIKNLEFRAKLPQIFRIFAIGGLALTLIAIGIGFYLNYGKEDFRMKGLKDLQLSQNVMAEINGYERRENDGEKLNYYIKADKVKTFTDNHQEMENIFLQVYDATSQKSDQITAESAIYVPDKENSKVFTLFFAGDVNINSRDGLQVKTEQLTYKKATEIADAEEYIEFERENVSGNSIGAIVNTKEKTLELLKDVHITAFGKEGGELEKIENAKITAGRAFFNQPAEKIEFNDNVNINITPNEKSNEMSQPTDIQANQAIALFTNKELNQIDLNGNVFVYQKPTSTNPKWTKTKANRATAKIQKELKRLELFENVDIETTANKEKPTKVTSNYALYEKDADRFELKNGVEILTSEDNKDTTIRAQNAIYEQTNGKIFLNGNAEIIQPTDYIKGDNLTAYLTAKKQVKSANAKGNAYLKQTNPERTTEISAAELNAIFDDNQKIESANTLGQSKATMIPANTESYTRVSLSAPNAIKLDFKTGLLNQMQTEGRTTISLDVPNNNPQASNKKLTADSVKTIWNDNGKDLAKAEAVGNAELYIEPLRNAPDNYKTTINAPRFDCDFYAENNAKNCAAATNVKAVRVPTVDRANRGKQTLTSNRMNVGFNQQTKDLEKFEAIGNAKFNELERNGIAENLTFTQGDEFVRLRGGEPTVWDLQARAKAGEIDWDTKNNKSYFRNKVSTTYYSQKKTGGATPFGATDSPVFLTANEANLDHTAETAVYTGNARAWQENNYVRAEKLVLNQKEGKLYGEGKVQSLLYDAKRKENGKEINVPVYASSDKLFYTKDSNYLKYEGNVDIRQQTDRIMAGVANIYLNDKNEVSQTIAENNVVITQPNRKALGEYAKYDASDESIILRGNPAKVDDKENGSSQAAQMTVYMRENRVVAESKTTENNSGRIRSVYKVKNQE